MPINAALMAKAKKQESEERFIKKMGHYSSPKIVQLYNVVEKGSGKTVATSVPLEHILSYGKAARGYKLMPVHH